MAQAVSVPISADTSGAGPARAALDAGARVINDVSGLRDRAWVAGQGRAGRRLILMASPSAPAVRHGSTDPVAR